MQNKNPNGQKPPPDNLHFERSEVKCERCKKTFVGLVREEIDGLAQLRLGDCLVLHMKMTCLYCGEIFNWNVREKDIEKMAVTYRELVVRINAYKPE